MDPVGIDDQQLEVVERELDGHSFATAEARWAYERARRLRVVLRLLGGLVFLLVFGWGMYRLGGGGGRGKAGGEEQQCAQGAKAEKFGPVGSPDAKIKITAIVPSDSECHSDIVKFLSRTAKGHPQQIRLEVKNMEDFSKSELSGIAGSVCAALMINGKTEFDLTYKGKKRHISLVGTVPTHYTLGDLGLVITDLYKRYYGEPDSPVVVIPKGQEPRDEEHDHPPDAGVEVKAPPKIDIKPEDLLLPTFEPKKTGVGEGAPASEKAADLPKTKDR